MGVGDREENEMRKNIWERKRGRKISNKEEKGRKGRERQEG
jgi:hypothetical protein